MHPSMPPPLSSMAVGLLPALPRQRRLEQGKGSGGASTPGTWHWSDGGGGGVGVVDLGVKIFEGGGSRASGGVAKWRIQVEASRKFSAPLW